MIITILIILAVFSLSYAIVYFTMRKDQYRNIPARQFIEVQKTPAFAIVSFLSSPILLIIWVFKKFKK
jgi:hypothetical protein